ncbi:hypothetical protein Tco_0990284 [Tanacetum coccineum]|uniref:Uncharacterized protein n=1 Tax=Tanacetum coccineum TaxID=301880 RepID=A0ABQ5EX66_9ASTR
MVNKIETPKSKEPERALEEELKDLNLKLPVLEVLAHASMYNAILDKYVESLELGKNRHKEDEHMPLILGTPFLTTARAKIKFHKGSMTLKAGKYKIRFVTTLKFPSKIEERIERDLNPMIPTNYVNRRVLEWEEIIKICQENEIGFIKWRFKVFDDKNLIGHNFFFYELEKEGSTAKAEGVA